MEKQRLTQAEQAVLMWPMLALAARTQQILSYGAVEGFTGIARQGLNHALGLIHIYRKKRGWPLLNAIVINQDSGCLARGSQKAGANADSDGASQSVCFRLVWA